MAFLVEDCFSQKLHYFDDSKRQTSLHFVDCKSQFRCKGTVFSPYMQILAAKNAVYLRFLAANGIFTVIQYVKDRVRQ